MGSQPQQQQQQQDTATSSSGSGGSSRRAELEPEVGALFRSKHFNVNKRRHTAPR